MVPFLSIIFFSWIYSIFVGFFKSSRFLFHPVCAYRIQNNCNFQSETRCRRFAFLISGKKALVSGKCSSTLREKFDAYRTASAVCALPIGQHLRCARCLQDNICGVRAAYRTTSAVCSLPIGQQKGFAFSQCFPVCFVSSAGRTDVGVRDAGPCQ